MARAAEEIQTLLALIVVRSIAEEQRLRTLAARVRLVARVQVEVEASVSRALDALNRSVHDHPDRLESTGHGRPGLPLQSPNLLGGKIIEVHIGAA